MYWRGKPVILLDGPLCKPKSPEKCLIEFKDTGETKLVSRREVKKGVRYGN